jgi:MFS family permease
MITMAIQFLFLTRYNLEPAQASLYLSFQHLPWTWKLFYGIFTDVFPICGSTKRAYVFLMGILQASACILVVLGGTNLTATTLMLLGVLNSLGGAVMDVVVDGMMVINSRKDPTSGSEELQAYSWGFYGLGGIAGCLGSGFLLDDTNGNVPQPYWCFAIMAFFGASVGISGLFIDKSLEEGQDSMVKMTFCQRSRFVLGEVKTGLKLKELYSALVYQSVLGAVVPSFSTYLYYYQIDVKNFTQMMYSTLQMVGYVTLITGSIMFNVFMKEKEFSFMMIIACFVNFIGSATTVMFTTDHMLGIPPFLFVLFTGTVTDTLY